MFSCGKKPLCLRFLLFKQSTRCTEFILTAAWGSSAWKSPVLPSFPLAVKTKTQVRVMDFWPVQEAFQSRAWWLLGEAWISSLPEKRNQFVPETPMENWRTVLNWGHLFSTVTPNSSSTPMLTRPNFLKLPLSFTPLWIFNYTERAQKATSHSPLSEPDSQVEIPHLSNMGAAPVTVHLITRGPAQSPDTTQHRSTRTRAHTQTRVHAQKIKMNFLATYGGSRGWMVMMVGLQEGWEVGGGGEKLSFPNSSLIFRG